MWRAIILDQVSAPQGLLVRDAESCYLTAESVDADNETPMNQLLGS
jgi:hypothetical protein